MNKTEMIQMRLDGYTYAQIAKAAGITRQRVQQIIAPPTSVRTYIITKYRGKCSKCGLHVGKSGHIHHISDKTLVENYSDIENLTLLCPGCHLQAHYIGLPVEEAGKISIDSLSDFKFV
jgi:hypothetical protein